MLIVQSNTGLLFRVDPDTGVTTTVDLGGQTLPAGDGMLLRGNILYVVQNRLNTVVKLRLDADGTRGEVVTRVTDPRFDVPTTIAGYGPRLYLPNARFSTPPTPDTPYTAVAITAPDAVRWPGAQGCQAGLVPIVVSRCVARDSAT